MSQKINEGLERIVQTHVYGKNGTTGKEFLRGYYTELTDETFNNAKMKRNKKENSEKQKS